jgi:hypothetical protein
MYTEARILGRVDMIFTRRFGALAARPQFPDAPELQQELNTPVDLDAELAQLSADGAAREDRRRADESAA